MKRALPGLLAILLALATACGGGGNSSGGGGGSTNLNASFTADEPNPGSKTISLSQGSNTNDMVTVRVDVTDTNGIFGAAFDLLYDPAIATFVNWSAGTVLEQGGGSGSYQVGATQSGRLVVGASRQGGDSGTDVSGTKALILLTFRMTQAGSSAAVFDNAALLDDSIQPQPIPGLSLFGGTLVAN